MPQIGVATDMVHILSLHDQNDINESTRTQFDAISTAFPKLSGQMTTSFFQLSHNERNAVSR